jgi:hypothetical protein
MTTDNVTLRASPLAAPIRNGRGRCRLPATPHHATMIDAIAVSTTVRLSRKTTERNHVSGLGSPGHGSGFRTSVIVGGFRRVGLVAGPVPTPGAGMAGLRDHRGMFPSGRLATVLIVLLGLAACSEPAAAPRFVEVHFPGSYTLPGTVEIPAAGEYAIWATGFPTVGANRCAVTGTGGATVPMSVPDETVTWTAKDEDDAVYTRTDTFTAPAAGTYTLRCTPDASAPGMSFAVAPSA